MDSYNLYAIFWRIEFDEDDLSEQVVNLTSISYCHEDVGRLKVFRFLCLHYVDWGCSS